MAMIRRTWSDRELRVQARQGYSSTAAALRLGPALAAIQQKAAACGISLNDGRAGRRTLSPS